MKVHYSSKNHEWETPQDLFDRLNREFEFSLDAAATHENAKCEKYFTAEDNALEQDWIGNVFCNPPYGRAIASFVRKAHEESLLRRGVIVMLIPARTDTRWFHDYIYDKAEIRFLKGRVKFCQNGVPAQAAPFPSMVVIYR